MILTFKVLSPKWQCKTSNMITHLPSTAPLRKPPALLLFKLTATSADALVGFQVPTTTKAKITVKQIVDTPF